MISAALKEYIASVITEFDQITAERKAVLRKISDFVRAKRDAREVISLILICTHNSRRSHLSQVWAQVAAHHYQIPRVYAYSGGTEATALFPSAADALIKAGFGVFKISDGNNPVYAIKYDNTEPPIIGFSKRYDDVFNPYDGYAAIMTCTQADHHCPYIAEAETRISLPFEDPKAFDGTPEQAAKYEERCRDIARELFYAFSMV